MTLSPKPPISFIDDVQAAAGQPARLALLTLESQDYPWAAEARALVTSISVPVAPVCDHSILFTGHMIDAPTRPHPRFPARAEPAARAAILNALVALQSGSTIGVAGGASGGDILFHECCHALKIPTLLRLTLPEPDFIAASIAPALGDWTARFHALVQRLGPSTIQVLGPSKALPEWMGSHPHYDVWQRTNLWLIQEAIQLAPRRSLIALWDGKPGDGPGGTEHLIASAPSFGVEVASVIYTTELFT